jgi:ABC-type molybdate transport system substrate-binding protein
VVTQTGGHEAEGCHKSFRIRWVISLGYSSKYLTGSPQRTSSLIAYWNVCDTRGVGLIHRGQEAIRGSSDGISSVKLLWPIWYAVSGSSRETCVYKVLEVAVHTGFHLPNGILKNAKNRATTFVNYLMFSQNNTYLIGNKVVIKIKVSRKYNLKKSSRCWIK